MLHISGKKLQRHESQRLHNRSCSFPSTGSYMMCNSRLGTSRAEALTFKLGFLTERTVSFGRIDGAVACCSSDISGEVHCPVPDQMVPSSRFNGFIGSLSAQNVA
ncbi:hypothetical protein J6590_016571 [Homalodisca vitripennis]|nr:hypothetical protein J6590_016571 [Homalodisca vitripennis]